MFADKRGGENRTCGEKSEVMAVVQVKTASLKADHWKYWTISDLVESTWTLLENGEGGGMGVAGGCLAHWRLMQYSPLVVLRVLFQGGAWAV